MPFLVARLTLVAWALLETGLRVHERLHGRGGGARDRATRILIGVSIAAGVLAAVYVASRPPSLAIPTGVSHVAGVAVMWLGLALRGWAIVTLGSAFRTTVEVDPDQAVVSHGPYAWIRHPSYTGLLLVLAGFGLALGDWLSFALCVVVPLPAIVRRIHVEEAELDLVLGDAYRTYRTRTRRLVPGVW